MNVNDMVNLFNKINSFPILSESTSSTETSRQGYYFRLSKK